MPLSFVLGHEYMDPTTRKFVQLLHAPEVELRAAALRVLAELELGGQPVIQAVVKSLREPREDLQILALKALHRLGAGEAAEFIVPLIANSGVLGEHAMAIVTAIGQKAVPALLKLYSESTDISTRRSVATALAETGGKAALQFLVERLPKETNDLQRHLISSLCDALDRTSPAEQQVVYPQVASLLRSSTEQTRIGAINVLGHFRHPETILQARAALRRFADRKHSLESRRYALLSYQRLLGAGNSQPEDLKFLREMLCDPDWQNIAHHALASLERLDISKRDVAFLNDLLKRSPHFPVRSYVLRVLENVDRPEVAQSILPFLADPDPSVRERSEETLRGLPSAAPLLLDVLRDTDDVEVAQRAFAVLRDMPIDVRKRWLDRAVELLIDSFDRNLERYQFFLEFVRGVDPDPLRKRIYKIARSLKTGRSRERWQRMIDYLRLLWDHHLITPEGRYLLAVALIKVGAKEISPAARKEDLGLQVIRALIYDDQEHLVRSLRRDKDLKPEDYFYLGFHFVEEGEATRGFGITMLEHVLRTAPSSSRTRSAALHKLESLQVPIPQAARGRRKDRAEKESGATDQVVEMPRAADVEAIPARRAAGGESSSPADASRARGAGGAAGRRASRGASASAAEPSGRKSATSSGSSKGGSKISSAGATRTKAAAPAAARKTASSKAAVPSAPAPKTKRGGSSTSPASSSGAARTGAKGGKSPALPAKSAKSAKSGSTTSKAARAKTVTKSKPAKKTSSTSRAKADADEGRGKRREKTAAGKKRRTKR